MHNRAQHPCNMIVAGVRTQDKRIGACFAAAAAAGETTSPGIEPGTETPGLRPIFFLHAYVRQIQWVSNPGKCYRTATSQRGPANAYLAPTACRAHTSRDVGATLNRTRTEHTPHLSRNDRRYAATRQNQTARDNPLQ
jgi:hypothetical protein